MTGILELLRDVGLALLLVLIALAWRWWVTHTPTAKPAPRKDRPERAEPYDPGQAIYEHQLLCQKRAWEESDLGRVAA